MSRAIKRIIGIVAFLVGLVLFIGLASVAAVMHFNSPPAFSPDSFAAQEGIALEPVPDLDSETPPTIRFEVYRGESARSVGQRLAEAGLIRHKYFWYLLCRYNTEPVKAGAYLIEVPISQMAIHRILVSGKQILTRVTVPEGYTLKKAAALLEEAEICPAQDFLAAAADPQILKQYRIPGKTMEGYLYPDTYMFPAGYPAVRVVREMADTFFAKIAELPVYKKGQDVSAGGALDMSPDELNRIVILASIIEREYRVDDEAPMMAGVFYNRLYIGMALQSCATVEYVITEIQGKPHPEVLYTRDTEIRNPYNTYMYPGLPPGPICSPGWIALHAAVNPSQNSGAPYLYFRLIDVDSGRHYFSNTLDEHIRAGALYTKR